jgi:hypothetical protein
MSCVYRGWEEELKELNTWSDEKKQNYLDTYSQKYIVCDAENVPKDVLMNKYDEHIQSLQAKKVELNVDNS